MGEQRKKKKKNMNNWEKNNLSLEEERRKKKRKQKKLEEERKDAENGRALKAKHNKQPQMVHYNFAFNHLHALKMVSMLTFHLKHRREIYNGSVEISRPTDSSWC